VQHVLDVINSIPVSTAATLEKHALNVPDDYICSLQMSPPEHESCVDFILFVGSNN